MGLQQGAGQRLDATQVPESLHGLIPLVERWAFEGLEAQDFFVTEMLESKPEEVQAFNVAMDQAAEAIDEWGKRFSSGSLSSMTDEERASPYWAFLAAQKVREITGYREDDPDVLRARERFDAEDAVSRYREATLQASEAFRVGNYASFVALLQPFESFLTPAQVLKMKIARQRTGSSPAANRA